MIQKSKTTELHLAQARELNFTMAKLNDLNMDVVRVDYDQKRIEVTRPANDRKVNEFPPLRCENNITLIKIKGFTVYWMNQAEPRDLGYARAQNMKTRCPACGALCSLDALIANDEASNALVVITRLGGNFSRAWLKYLGLFRPEKAQLTFDRVAKLTNECLHDIERQRISRGGRDYDAPPESWLYAIDQMIKARDSGNLKTPIKSHGYLYEIMSKYEPKAPSLVITVPVEVVDIPKPKPQLTDEERAERQKAYNVLGEFRKGFKQGEPV